MGLGLAADLIAAVTVVVARMIDPVLFIGCLCVAAPTAGLQDRGLRFALALTGAFAIATAFTALGAYVANLNGGARYAVAPEFLSFLAAAAIETWLIQIAIRAFRAGAAGSP